MTTKGFLDHFGLDTLRDLPDLEALQDAGLLQEGPGTLEDGLSMDSLDEPAGGFEADSLP